MASLTKITWNKRGAKTLKQKLNRQKRLKRETKQGLTTQAKIAALEAEMVKA